MKPYHVFVLSLFAEALRHRDDPKFREMFARFAPADARWRLFWP